MDSQIVFFECLEYYLFPRSISEILRFMCCTFCHTTQSDKSLDQLSVDNEAKLILLFVSVIY